MHVFVTKWFRGMTVIGVVALGTLLLLPDRPLRWDGVFAELGARTASTLQAARGAKKHIPGIEYYYNSRRYGNPGINVEMKLLEAQMEVASRLNKGFDKASEGNAWQVLGPGNIAGRVRALAIRPDNPNVVFAGGASGGVFKSTNGGQGDWRPVMDFADAIPVGAIAIDPTNPDVMYAGTGEPTMELTKSYGAPSYSGVGVMKSTDAGESWTRLPWPQSSSAIHEIIIDPRNTQIIFAASRSHLWRTEDGGQVWTRVQTGVATDVVFRPDNPDVVFVGIGNDNGAVANGVYRSVENGQQYKWAKVATNFPASDSVGRIKLAVTPANPNLLLAFVMRARKYQSGESDFLAVMRTTNNGDTWERLPSNLPTDFTSGQGFYNLCAAISPTNADTIHAGGYEVWRSGNGGTSWMRVTRYNEPVHVDQHVLKYSPDNRWLYLGNDGGVYRTENKGSSWFTLERSLETIQFYTMAYDPNNADRFYGGAQDHGIFQSFNVGNKEWRLRRGGDGGYIVVDPTNPNIVYSRLAIDGGDVSVPARSNNSGQSWTRLDNGFSGDRFNWLPPMMLSPTDRTRMYTATQFVYTTKGVDTGNPGWTKISGDVTKSNSGLSVVTTMDICESTPNTMYIGCGDGMVRVATNLNALDVEWIDISKNLPNRWVSRVKVDRRNAATAYVAYSGYGTGHVWKTTNYGESWTDISGNLPDLPVNSMTISRTDPDNTLFVATDLGVWYTRDGGTNWSRFGEGLPNVVVYDIDIDKQNRLIAATHGRGMWITEATVNSTSNVAPDVFALQQNFPNPLRSGESAIIRFSLPTSSEITVKLYDAAGRLVRTLAEGRRSQGSHVLSVDASGLRSGVYFYTLSDGRSSSSRKLLVM